jgi:3-oxoacyl-[acyl-carrier protein] reductase
MGPLKGRIALVTGASRGIGRAIAWRLACADADVVLLARSREELSELALEIKTAGREAMSLATDLRDPAQVSRSVERALAYFGRVDILVNNAGLWRYAPVHELSLEDWDEMFEVNLRGAFLVTRALLPSMLARGRGHIVNIASVSGLVGEPEGAGYCATKWGLRGFSESLHQEVAARGIRVTVINPALVNHQGLSGGEPSLMIQNEDIAELVALAVTLPPRTTLYEATLYDATGE